MPEKQTNTANSKSAEITKEQENHTFAAKCILEEYATADVRRDIMRLKNQKSHGSEGIPEESYRAVKQWVVRDICEIANQIIHGHPLPTEWVQ